jgi:hypothetical protein
VGDMQTPTTFGGLLWFKSLNGTLVGLAGYG